MGTHNTYPGMKGISKNISPILMRIDWFTKALIHILNIYFLAMALDCEQKTKMSSNNSSHTSLHDKEIIKQPSSK